MGWTDEQTDTSWQADRQTDRKLDELQPQTASTAAPSNQSCV